MINRTAIGFLALMCASFALPAFAQQVPNGIATIRAAELVQTSPQYKDGQAKMKAEFERRRTDLEAEAKKLGDDVQKYKREGDVMAPDARAKMEKDLNARKVDFDYKQRQFQEDLQKRERELTDAMMGKIRDIITQVATERGAKVVIQDPVWMTPDTDITDEVLKRLQAAQ